MFYKKRYKKAQAKLDLLSHLDLIDVRLFNDWFCDATKDPEIYANYGIFLRLDKLSHTHAIHYVHSLTKELSFKEVTDLYFTHSLYYMKFYQMIIDDWKNKLNEKQK